MAREPKISKGKKLQRSSLRAVRIESGNRIVSDEPLLVDPRDLAYRYAMAGQVDTRGGTLDFEGSTPGNWESQEVDLSEEGILTVVWVSEEPTQLRWTEQREGQDILINIWEPRPDGSSIAIDAERRYLTAQSEDGRIKVAYDRRKKRNDSDGGPKGGKN